MRARAYRQPRGSGFVLACLLASLAGALTGCGETRSTPTAPAPQPTPPPAPQPVPPPAPTPGPRVRFTRYMAFGDSLTFGTFSTAAAPLVYFAAADEAYPVVLQRLLQQRYREQVIAVQNEGWPGESAFASWLRLQEKLRAQRPEVLLLMEGANDLLSCAGLSAALVNGCVTQTVSSLNRLVSEARFSQVPVFVATLPPQRPGTPRGVAFALVDQYNRGVREVARGEAPNATLVDANVYFGGNLALIGPDGLHPTGQGYAVIAQAFFDTITRLYQLPPAAPVTAPAADPTD